MRSSDNQTPKVTFENGIVSVLYPDNVTISFPVKGNKRLAKGLPSQILNVVVTKFGIHWPDLDEDLSFEGLAHGDYGQYAK